MNNIVPVELVNSPIRKLKYQVLLDLDRDNVFETDISDDCTIDYVNTDLEIKIQGEALGKPSVSTASITMFNETGRYSPNRTDNIESEHIGWKFRRNTQVQILGGFINTNNVTYTQELFRGVITNLKNNVKNKTVNLTLKDLAKFAQKKKNPNHTYVNGKYYEGVLFDVSISDAVSYLIEFVYGENFPCDIDALTVVYPCIKFPVGDNVWATLQKLCEAAGAWMYFDGGRFKFYTPMNSQHYNPNVSQYTFVGDNIFDLTESIDEESIFNKFIIESDGETLQPRQVISGTPSTNVLTGVDFYKTGDGKSILNEYKNVITLKSQEPNTQEWIDSIYVPLVQTTTYDDIVAVNSAPTWEDIEKMMEESIIKVWDRLHSKQLPIKSIDYKAGKILLLNQLEEPYDLQITYQYYIDQIVSGKYKLYEFSFDKTCRNIELPNIEVHNTIDMLPYSTENPENTVYLSDWKILDGNQRVTFRLTNNVPATVSGSLTLDTAYISKMEISGNPLDCVNHLTVKAEDSTTLTEFENPYTITNNYIIDQTWGQQLIDYYLFRNKSDKAYMDITVPGMPQLQLLDRVTLIEANTGHNDDFTVIAIKHSPRIDGWKTQISLEALQPTWTYDESHTSVIFPIYNNSSLLTLPEITILSNDAIEDDFANDTLTHSVVLNFTSPASFNISDFLEGKILYREYNSVSTSWGRYITAGSFNDSYVSQFKVSGLKSDKQYKFYVIATNKRNQQSPYGDGYTLNMPTTAALQEEYGLIPAPDNIQLVKGLNKKLTASCAPTSASHYKSVRFQLVKESLPWTDSSVQTQTIKNTSVAFEIPDDDNYKVRVCFVDVWDREGVWSIDHGISGGGLTASDVSASFLEVKVSANATPVLGTLENLIDGTDNKVTFEQPVVITYTYPYDSIFDAIRIRVPSSTTMYAEVNNNDIWEPVVGTNDYPINVVANTVAEDANVFKFHTDGDFVNGTVTRKKVKEIRMTFPAGVSINEIMITTTQYLDTLQIGNGLKIGENIGINQDGIYAVKELEDQFRLDALTGSAYFGGTIKAGIIDCESLDDRLSALFNSFGPNCVLPNEDGSAGLKLVTITGEAEYWINADMDVSVDSTKTGGSYDNITYSYPYVSAPNQFGDYQDFAYIHWPINLSGGTVTDARIKLYCKSGATNYLNVYNVTTPWNESTKWTTKPAWSKIFTGDAVYSNSYYTLSNSALTSLASGWASKSINNYGIGLYGDYAKFCGRHDSNANLWPKLYLKVSGISTSRVVSIQTGYFRLGSIIYYLPESLSIECPANSTKLVVLTVDKITKNCSLSLIDDISQLLGNSIIVGKVTADDTTVASPDMTRGTGRKDGSASFSAFGVGGDGMTGGLPAGDVYVGSWILLSSNSAVTWSHNLGSGMLDVRGQFRTNATAPILNINTLYNTGGIEISQPTDNTVTFSSGTTVHYTRTSSGTYTSYTSGLVRPIVYKLG